jgi:two-component system, OmpR family, response regulator MprA
VSYRVLLADDDRAIRESLERALELEGDAVTSVIDGVRALSVAAGMPRTWLPST